MKKNIQTLILKVAEAQGRDLGRGIGRIDPSQLKKLGLGIGDVAEILGKKKTVIKLMPTFPEDRGKGIIQIDGITRENAKVGLDEKVKIQKVSYDQAETVILSPITLTSSLPDEENRE